MNDKDKPSLNNSPELQKHFVTEVIQFHLWLYEKKILSLDENSELLFRLDSEIVSYERIIKEKFDDFWVKDFKLYISPRPQILAELEKAISSKAYVASYIFFVALVEHDLNNFYDQYLLLMEIDQKKRKRMLRRMGLDIKMDWLELILEIESVTDDLRKKISKIIEFRNYFIHFKPHRVDFENYENTVAGRALYPPKDFSIKEVFEEWIQIDNELLYYLEEKFPLLKAIFDEADFLLESMNNQQTE